MLDTLKNISRSLRFRLVAAASIVLVLMLAVLVANSVRLMDSALIERENERLTELRVLLNAALAEPLAETNYATLTRLVRQLRQDRGMVYVVLVDHNRRVVAAEGWDLDKPLPPTRKDFAELPRGASRFDGVTQLAIGQRVLGHLYFGVSTDFVRQAGNRLLWQSVAIGWAAFVLTVILLFAIGYWLTRNLRRLQQGVAALESGEATVRLAVGSNDEIGALTRAFNRMAQALDERVDALKKSESRFHAIADFTYGVEAWFNPQGRLIWINRSVERVTGYTPLECLLSANLIDMLVFDKDRKHALEVGVKALRGSTGDNFEVRLKRKDGAVVWIVLNWQPIYSDSNEYLGLRVSADEIQSRKEAELKQLDTVVELRRAQALKEYYLTHSNEERSRLEALLNVMKVGVLFVDSGHRIVYANKPCRHIWGIPESENMTGMRDTVLLDRTAALRADDAAYRSHVAEALAGSGVTEPFEIAMRDGRTVADVSALVPGAKPGQHIGRVWIYEDITRQKQLETELTQLAERDPLTNLYNRRRFHEELDRIIADASRRKAHAGLLAIDLDAFKPINDEFGHQAGDTVLTTLAAEVGSIVRRNEIFFRVGGDEFAILAPDTSEEEMIGLARRVGSTISGMRFTFNGRAARLTASLGIALYPNHALNGEEIIARADNAMYQAKLSGKNRWAVYRDPTLH
ncbi:MAG: PAS domain S-box protein [Rhodocyclaceae bacterium]|jgi:diguanylate cyclase (GGDEF)-like protein/PAS domain S-box-containing protein|nr:PAS domain S-box protein [Rhodocyclaceae bacterium]